MHRFIKYPLRIRYMDDNGLDSGNVRKAGEFLEGMPAGAYEVDEQGNYLYCNQEAANILGYDSPEELMQKISTISISVENTGAGFWKE